MLGTFTEAFAKPSSKSTPPVKVSQKNKTILVENKRFLLEGTEYVSLLYVKNAISNKRKKL